MSEILRLLAGRKPMFVVHVQNPPIDKIVGHVFSEHHFGCILEIRGYWRNTECPDRQVDAWLQNGILPIDIGRFKYHDKASSATRFLCRELGIEPTPRRKQLVEIIDENNRTGFLKQSFMSIAWVLREGFEFWNDPRQRDEVIRRAKNVVNVWLAVTSPELVSEAKLRALMEFPDLWSATEACGEDPLTVREYLVHLCAHDTDDAQIRQLVTWWINTWNTLRKEKRGARAAADQVLRNAPRIPFGRFSGVTVQGDSRFLVKALAEKIGVVISTNADGHLAILARNLDIHQAAQAIQELEPDRWYAGPGFIVNGTPMYDRMQPTDLELDEVIALLQKYPPKPFASTSNHKIQQRRRAARSTERNER